MCFSVLSGAEMLKVLNGADTPTRALGAWQSVVSRWLEVLVWANRKHRKIELCPTVGSICQWEVSWRHGG